MTKTLPSDMAAVDCAWQRQRVGDVDRRSKVLTRNTSILWA